MTALPVDDATNDLPGAVVLVILSPVHPVGAHWCHDVARTRSRGLIRCHWTVRQAPIEPLVDSQVSIRQAEDAGAAQNPDAAQHLEWARQQTLGARRLIEQNRRDEAALFLKRAAVDAELALALAREAPARAEADQLLEQVRQLQQETVQ